MSGKGGLECGAGQGSMGGAGGHDGLPLPLLAPTWQEEQLSPDAEGEPAVPELPGRWTGAGREPGPGLRGPMAATPGPPEGRPEGPSVPWEWGRCWAALVSSRAPQPRTREVPWSSERHGAHPPGPSVLLPPERWLPRQNRGLLLVRGDQDSGCASRTSPSLRGRPLRTDFQRSCVQAPASHSARVPIPPQPPPGSHAASQVLRLPGQEG